MISNKRHLRWLLLVASLALLLTGCSGRRLASTSWPGAVVDDNMAYIAFGQEFFAVDPEGQLVEWRYPNTVEANSQITYYAPPAVSDGLLVVGGYDSVLYGVDRETHDIEWNFNRSTGRYVGGPVVLGNKVFAATAGNELFVLNLDVLGELGAVEKADEARREREKAAVEWEFTAEQGFWSAPLVTPDVLFVGSLDHHVYAIKTESGELIWKEELPGAIAGTPLISDDGETLYVGNFDYNLYALDAASGRQLWQVAAQNWIWGSPVMAHNTVYFGDLDGYLYAVQAETGKVLWQEKVADAIRGGPVFDSERNLLYITGRKESNPGGVGTRGIVIAMDVETKKVLWEQANAEAIYSSPMLAGEMLLVTPAQGSALVQVLGAETGVVQWEFVPHPEE